MSADEPLPATDWERFCIYCQREYASHANLVRHIARKHPGTYAYATFVTDRAIDDK